MYPVLIRAFGTLNSKCTVVAKKEVSPTQRASARGHPKGKALDLQRKTRLETFVPVRWLRYPGLRIPERKYGVTVLPTRGFRETSTTQA